MNRNYDFTDSNGFRRRSATFVKGDKKSDYPYSTVITSYVKDTYSIDGFVFKGDMGLGSLISVPQSHMDNIHINNLNKAYDKLRDSSFSGSVFLAEGHQTLHMLGNTISTLASAVSYVRRGDLNRACRSLGVSPNRGEPFNRLWANNQKKDALSGVLKSTSLGASNSWLQLSFGWLPLVSDIYNGSEALANLRYRPRRLTARGSNRRNDGSSSYNDFLEYDAGYARWSTSVSYSSSVLLSISAPVPDNGRLGLNTPYTALWNLVPWSFLLDYIIPIGDYLQAKESINKIDVIRFVKSEKTVHRMIGNWTWDRPSTPALYTSTRFVRSIIAPNEAKNIPLPGFKPVSKIFSTNHVLNSIALLRQAFR